MRQDGWRLQLNIRSCFDPDGTKYYAEFRKQTVAKNASLSWPRIFSFSANEEEPEGLLLDEDLNIETFDQSSSGLSSLQRYDYNAVFNTNYDKHLLYTSKLLQTFPCG